MNSRELAERLLAGERPERALFCPAIYEHKARLIGASVSQIAQDADKLAKACLAEWQAYRPDMLTVGVDVYNVEPEILGAVVSYPAAPDAVPELREATIKSIDSFEFPEIDDVGNKARARLFIDATVKVHKAVGREVMVRGSISGPYSIAAAMMGMEPAIMASVLEPAKMGKLLDYCCDLAISYGEEYARLGLGVCMFDSQAVPPLLSPDTYEQLVLPRVQRVAMALKQAGAEVLEYVTGGNTTSIAKALVKTGFDIILSDFPSDAKVFVEATKNTAVIIRRNISPVVIENAAKDELEKAVKEVLKLASENDNVIIGTGVLSYNLPSQNIIDVKNLITR